MIQVVACIFQQHDLRLLVLATLLCGLACATAFSMISRGRAADTPRLRALWLGGAGAVAGSGIWATHFIAMLAYSTNLPLAFDPEITALSAAVGMVFCAFGFAMTQSRAGGAGGGVMVGFAISAMHYTGMAGLEVPGYAVWDIRYIVASTLIGLSLSGLALHFGCKGGRRNLVLGAGLFILAIIGMHFTGMTAVQFVPDGRALASNHVMHPLALAAVVAACASFIVSQGLVVALVDRHLEARAHGEALRMRTHITELEATKKALEKSSDKTMAALHKAAEADKAKSAFLASMSHELRTPLNAIIGFSDTMIMEVFGNMPPRYRDYARDIHASGAHLLALINDVLDLSRLDAGHADLRDETFDLGDLIGECLRMVTGQAEAAQITLVADIAPDLPALRADKRRIKQVLINLLSNALKFTPAEGRVRLSARLEGGALVMAVADTGIGIAPADIPKVMERFGQVDDIMTRKHEGTGLGLPLSKQLMELHGGALVLESVLKVGTTVTVTLPPERLVPAAAAA